jgi:hypothetical protein
VRGRRDDPGATRDEDQLERAGAGRPPITLSARTRLPMDHLQ